MHNQLTHEVGKCSYHVAACRHISLMPDVTVSPRGRSLGFHSDGTHAAGGTSTCSLVRRSALC